MRDIIFCILVGAAAIALVLVGLYSPSPDYHYKGIAEVPMETALQIQLEHGSERLSLATYSSGTDTVYITYNFWQKEPGLFGLDSEREPFRKVFPLVVLFGMSVVVTLLVVYRW